LVIAVMRFSHHHLAVLEKLRLFLVILEEGSLRRAAERLHLSQSAITRQIQSLEHDLGGRVLERTSTGVRPTSGGHALAEKAKGLIEHYDSTMAEVRRLVRGESERLRIGYVASAVQEYLAPALAAMRRGYPKVKVKMLDQTPGEMIIALRRGEIDLALTHHGVDLLSRDFYTHKLASVPSLARIRAQSCYSAIVFIDHQPQMLFGVASMDRASLIYQRHTCIHQGMTMSTRSKKLASPQCRRHVPRRRHRDPQAGEPGREGSRGSQVLAQIRHNFYARFLLARVLRFGVSPNYKGKQESGSGFCLQQ